MEKNNKEKGLVILTIIIIIILIIIIMYSIFVSNNNLRNNSPNRNKTTNNPTNIHDSIYSLNDNEIDEMTIDEEYVEEYEKNKTVETQISTFTSTLYDKDQNRIDNITLAISKINNLIIKAGEEFSFNNAVGPMDEAHGFKKAVGFDANGGKIQVSGGGMCQISSTMYNTALIANLEITERHAHSRRVYYVPQDKDATVYYGSLDLKFINNTNNDIRIVATNDNTNVTITFLKIEK